MPKKKKKKTRPMGYGQKGTSGYLKPGKLSVKELDRMLSDKPRKKKKGG